ncbi:hypothetical protein BGW80DRAFT_1446876 [Lactifluus volemus]|nr:hypothetical protein BGW80DRAFT_1446876 [Lactifluus volemus]
MAALFSHCPPMCFLSLLLFQRASPRRNFTRAADLLSTLASPCQPPLPLAAAAASVTCILVWGKVVVPPHMSGRWGLQHLAIDGANLVCFVLGVDGVQYFVHELTGGWDGNPRNSIRANDGVAKMGTMWWSGSRCHRQDHQTQEQEQNNDDDDDDDPDLSLAAAAPWRVPQHLRPTHPPPSCTNSQIHAHAIASSRTRSSHAHAQSGRWGQR